MAINAEKIIKQYSAYNEDGRAASSRSAGLEFYYTKKHLEGLIKKTDRVLEVGCATGHYGFYYAGQCREYVGVDIVPEHIRMMKEKIAASGVDRLSCHVGDATDLSEFDDESFDVVLCLGPMYHLPPQERERAFTQCARVCKTGGIAAFAYISSIGVYAGACVLYDSYPNPLANRCVLENGHDDTRPDTFFYVTPEQLNAAAKEHGLAKIKNLGTDFFVTMELVDAMSDEQFEIMRPLYDQMTSLESCTGMASHALLVCRKQREG